MELNLTQLKPNPFRVFAVDPIDMDAVASLAESIEQDGFWGGVVARQNDQGEYEVACGHHRVQAAISAGYEYAEIFVADLDDEAMIRIYARENATQRGNHSTAVAGTVASAIRFLAKAQFLGISVEINRNENKRQDIGRDALHDFLKDVPGVTRNSVQEQLASLKTAGHYANIIREAQEEADAELRAEQERIAAEIEAEEKRRKQAEEQAKRDAEAAEKARVAYEKRAAEAKKKADEAEAKRLESERKAELRRAEEKAKREALEAEEARKRQAKLDVEREALQGKRQKAMTVADKAAKQEVEFDFTGVAMVFKNDAQVRAFRDIALSTGIKPYLPIANQKQVAEEIVRKLEEENKGKQTPRELSAAFIREWFYKVLHGVKNTEKSEKKKRDQSEIDRIGRQERAKRLQQDFARNANSMARIGGEINDLINSMPKGEPFPVTQEFKNSLKNISWAVGVMKKHNLI